MTPRKRPFKVSSSAAIIGGNDDLLLEIFLFLPAKSLIRFKLVSKSWQTLISTHSFSRLHTFHRRRRRPRRIPEHSFLLRAKTSHFFVCDPTIRRLVPFQFGFPFVKILQSCNGLLLLECRNAVNGPKNYYTFNPTTMRYRNLLLNSRRADGFRLTFDPSRSPHYKVVCLPSHKNPTNFLVYDSEKHEWQDERRSCMTYKFWRGFYFNDDVRFVRYFPLSFGFVPDHPRVHSPGEKMKNYTVESNGCWHHLRLCLMPKKKQLRVYKTRDIERGWSKKYRAVDFNPISAAFSGNNGTEIELLGMVRRERGDGSILLFHVPGKIMIYRFGDKVFEEFVDFTGEDYFQEDQLQFQFHATHRFIYSLAPV